MEFMCRAREGPSAKFYNMSEALCWLHKQSDATHCGKSISNLIVRTSPVLWKPYGLFSEVLVVAGHKGELSLFHKRGLHHISKNVRWHCSKLNYAALQYICQASGGAATLPHKCIWQNKHREEARKTCVQVDYTQKEISEGPDGPVNKTYSLHFRKPSVMCSSCMSTMRGRSISQIKSKGNKTTCEHVSRLQ